MIDKIFHIADVHIRNFYRHKEYERIFKKLFTYIKNNKTENSVIYLAGDIVHSKVEITPELVSLTARFLKGCADICPTILITGNHDTNLSNDKRMDALTPIVEMLNHDNLHYWKDNGVYKFNGIDFSVFSVYNSPEEWVKAKEIDGNYKVALYHGSVHNSSTDMNYLIENESVKSSIFDGFDLTLLGDIHKRQFLNDNKTIAYAGSLIQQNHGEGLDHGLMVWDVKTKKCKIVDIKNTVAYATIDVNNNSITSDKKYLDRLPKNLKLRLRHKNTTKAALYEITNKLKKKHKLLELTEINLNENNILNENKIHLKNIRDVEYQNQLLTEYIENLDDSSNYDINYIRNLNRQFNAEYNGNISDQKLVRNVVWKPKQFEFSNMFSYGENNKINFENFNGIKGLFAPNASGKSVLLDSIIFCLFDKCTKTYRSTDILNNKKKWFKCKLTFELNGRIYEIERHGKKNKNTGKVKVDVTFKEIKGDDVINLNGKDRDSTNKIIRNYLGTYDDFLLTSISSQNDNSNFIFKSQKERKELLNSFLDISIFESLYSIAREDLKNVEQDLHVVKTNLDNCDKDEIEENINKLKNDKEKYKDNIVSLRNEVKKLTDTIQEKNSNIKRFSETIDIEEVTSKIKSKTKLLHGVENKINECNDNIKKLNNTLKEVNVKLNDIKNIEYKKEDLNKYLKHIKHYEKRNTDLNYEIKTCKEKIELAEKTQYDPNCEYCRNNPLIEHGLRSKEILPSLEKDLNVVTKNMSRTKNFVIKLKKEINKFEELSQEKNSLITELESANNTLERELQRKESINFEISVLTDKKNAYNKQRKIQENNKILLKEVEELEKQKQSISKSLKSVEHRYLNTNHQLKSETEKLNEYIKLDQDFIHLTKKITNHKCYLNAISKHGVPYSIIKKIIPVIENDSNELLSEIVDFKLKINCDEKNIDCYIEYSDDKTWPVELGSGMEKFILSIAMRVALINISSLPRANFLAIDEGFGVLDPEKVNSIKLLFNVLKSKFDYIICITHLDSMKDLADSLIEISKNRSGFSKVYV